MWAEFVVCCPECSAYELTWFVCDCRDMRDMHEGTDEYNECKERLLLALNGLDPDDIEHFRLIDQAMRL